MKRLLKIRLKAYCWTELKLEYLNNKYNLKKPK